MTEQLRGLQVWVVPALAADTRIVRHPAGRAVNLDTTLFAIAGRPLSHEPNDGEHGVVMTVRALKEFPSEAFVSFKPHRPLHLLTMFWPSVAILSGGPILHHGPETDQAEGLYGTWPAFL